ncbi:MAG: potassium transporter Trk [Egibacteraceae bacterium]
MADLVYVGLAVALFVLSAWYVAGCERLIGRGDADEHGMSPDQESRHDR